MYCVSTISSNIPSLQLYDPTNGPNLATNLVHVPSDCDSNISPSFDFQVICLVLHILQLNVESLLAAKCSIISALATQHSIDIICLQETHVAISVAEHDDIDVFDYISHCPDVKHGHATYVCSNISDAIPVSSSSLHNMIQIGDFRIVNVYKLMCTGANRSSQHSIIQQSSLEISTVITLSGSTLIQMTTVSD